MRGLGKRPVEEMFTHLKTRGNESPEGILQMLHSHVTGPIDYLRKLGNIYRYMRDNNNMLLIHSDGGLRRM